MRSSKVLYVNQVNLSGLYSTKPVKCFRHRDVLNVVSGREGDTYWDRIGNVDCTPDELSANKRTKIIVEQNGIITKIVSLDSEPVMLWTQGALSLAQTIKTILG